MSDVVVDASVVAPFLIPDERSAQSDAVLSALVAGRGMVPQHWRLEIANLGRKAVRQRRMTRAEMHEAITLLATLPVSVDRQTDEMAWSRTLDLASDHDLTSYDAAYLELAKRSGLPLATVDKALAEAAARQGVALFDL